MATPAYPNILQNAQTRQVEQTRRYLESEGKAIDLGSPNPTLITAVIQEHHHTSQKSFESLHRACKTLPTLPPIYYPATPTPMEFD